MKDQKNKQNDIQEGNPKSRSTYHHGTTTQGGSTFGQGSLQLGKDAQKTSNEKSAGANYANEQGWNNEALRRKDQDMIPKRHK